MAPFTQRQVGYIKAIAGVGQHKSYVHYSNAKLAPGNTHVLDPLRTQTVPFQITSGVPSSDIIDITKKKMCSVVFQLDRCPVAADHTDVDPDINNHSLTAAKLNGPFGVVQNMHLLQCQASDEKNENLMHSTNHRVGDDFYLESTHVKWRFTMPDFAATIGGQTPHHEYRFIVFRQRKRTLGVSEASSNGSDAQWLNFNYDLFNGYHARPIGPMGYRKREHLDGSETYINDLPESVMGNSSSERITAKLDADDFMTLPLNTADYVVLKDERFFLGAEHGKSHYETVTHWDWTDPGSTPDKDMIHGLDDAKNYRWFFLLLGTTNNTIQPVLNIAVRGTTAITSA